MNLDAQFARFRLGLLSGEALPGVALEMMARGMDSQPLREVAALQRPALRDAAPLFEDAIRLAGVRLNATPEDQLIAVADSIRQIATGEVGPAVGAGEIAMFAIESGMPPELAVFVGLDAEWRDHEDDRAAIEEEIVAAARRLQFRILPPAA
jgi:hypothetical protein